MSLSLNTHMKTVLKNGVELLYDHKDSIMAEWKDILEYMKNANKKSAEAFEFAFHFFEHFLQNENLQTDTLLMDISSEWYRQFQRPPEPNMLIFILTLLENAVHKVIKANTTRSFHLHPAVQFLFSKICEEMLSISRKRQFHIDILCHQLVQSKQLHIEWVARIGHVENGYRFKKIIGIPEDAIQNNLYEVIKPSWFLLTESLLQLTGSQDNRDVFPIPWKGETLLFCTKNQNVTSIAPFLTYAMHLLQIEEGKRQEQWGSQWKDAVILFNEWIMKSHNLEEAIQNIAYGYAQYLPFERCALFKYSNEDETGLGLFGYHFNNEDIRNIKEHVDNIPSLYKSITKLNPQNEALKNFQPIYISNASKEFPSRYVQHFQLESVVVAPIYVPSEGELIAAAILDQGPGKHFQVDSNTFTALLKFGQSAGELLMKFSGANKWIGLDSGLVSLSSREIDVLELLAEGASTTEAAEKLHLSEYTVRDYISNIMKRLHAKNRTEAAVKAIRYGIIK
ncbi:response regulator transcription factor [Heyndrickxia camelliae]|uniref:Helix-turn-helix transcriptional regulator n=1 Tax=Heyndrickxia camelliae TaxID=1707093 RepID=A0A2N3LGT8_9BACI|nr:response regulator transcription factor [Heyndrickxia camelliae]PKR83809.1 helix-turn-helix transcriptional regulator [Heyndrickxia camelliae]